MPGTQRPVVLLMGEHGAAAVLDGNHPFELPQRDQRLHRVTKAGCKRILEHRGRDRDGLRDRLEPDDRSGRRQRNTSADRFGREEYVAVRSGLLRHARLADTFRDIGGDHAGQERFRCPDRGPCVPDHRAALFRGEGCALLRMSIDEDGRGRVGDRAILKEPIKALSVDGAPGVDRQDRGNRESP